MTTNLCIITAYCACTLCCGPNASNKTASGIKPIEGITIAASRKIPFNTTIYIPTIGYRKVQDRLAQRFDNRIDVYFLKHEKAKQFGKKKLKVIIYE